ncbi:MULTISPECIES: porin [Delftia]|uniref:porin n=1 Tax=Delftia TaxID=80865 RepID=UPI00035367FC|nr:MULTISPECIES: porin [Delftia]EPD43529.1 hypothetical protein HMPREF9701_00553 [Delftia acidovorans CCUG 274B]MCX7504773.1 porin [Delftia tsuruhatensis]MDH0418709.1 porin [Delftia tsuruhatensis]OJX11519.1 MAG: porin [Delftia sp. 67-8]OWG16688.1 Outer membrane porin protein 32 precursor [Delftia sp. K82]
MQVFIRQALAASLGLAAAHAGAQSSVSISGTVDVSVRQVRNQGLGTVTSQASGANSTSKLVLRGQEDLGDGLSAGFYLDGSLLADTGAMGASGPFWDRRSTVSLASRQWGELRLGRDWVPTHLVWSGFDPFATLGIGSANGFRSFTASRALGQAFGTAPESQAANPTLRVSNAVEYFLPAGLGGLQGVSGSLIATLGEKGATAAGQTRGNGFRLGWAGAGWNVAGAQFTTRNTLSGIHFKDQSYGVSYDFGWLKASLAQRRWVHGVDRTVNTLVGMSVPVGSGVVKLSYVKADQTGATAAQSASDADLWALGYVHSLSRRTALYAHAARMSNRNGAAFAIAGGAAVSGNPAAANYFGGRASTAFELGIRHDF